jgi:hypothetical protein
MGQAVIAANSSAWGWGIAGLFALIVGLVLVIRPRRAGEIWRRAVQATRPWRVVRMPVGVIVAAGCISLAVAVVFIYTSWMLIQW